MARPNLELYRGKPTIRNRRQVTSEVQDLDCPDEFEIIAMPPGTTVDEVLTGQVAVP